MSNEKVLHLPEETAELEDDDDPIPDVVDPFPDEAPDPSDVQREGPKNDPVPE